MQNTTLRDHIIATHWQALMPWLQEPDCQEIFVNPDGRIWRERSGQYESLTITLTSAQVMGSIHALMTSDTPHHYLETDYGRLRISAAWPPLTRPGPCLCLRRHHHAHLSHQPWPSYPASYCPAQTGYPSSDIWHEIRRSPRATLIIGATSTGKTTGIQWLLQQCQEERIITLEDTPELVAAGHPHCLQFYSPAATWGTLLPFILRCRPDRIIVGEIRGAESWDVINLYLSGHASGWTSWHADDPQRALTRLTQVIRTHPAAQHLNTTDIAHMIINSFAYIVHCKRWPHWRGPCTVDAIIDYDPRNGYQLIRLYDITSHI